jgi:hypothetical protein
MSRMQPVQWEYRQAGMKLYHVHLLSKSWNIWYRGGLVTLFPQEMFLLIAYCSTYTDGSAGAVLKYMELFRFFWHI